MKKLTIIYFLFFITKVFPQDIILEGDITEDLALTSDNTYLLKSYVRVHPPATLTIEKGTIIYGDYFPPGTLVIKSGAKIKAEGTKNEPIIFTSLYTREGSERKPDRADWGGIIILGNAPINVAGGIAPFEGIGDQYGGNDPFDSSGVLKFIRIEYSGMAWSLSNEIKAITFCGVGSKTVVENVQVSFPLDDSFAWFGGTVNCKNLVSYKSWDDDFDFDFGYKGNLQFLLSIRDKDVADPSGSNGIESDNDGAGSINEPRTSPTIYNATIIGPIENAATVYNSFYRRGMHIRRSSQGTYANTLIMGWPTGLLVDGKITAQDAQNGILILKNSIVTGSRVKDIDTIKTDGSFGLNSWFYNNSNRTFTENDEIKLIDPFNSTNPNPLPAHGSPTLTGAASPPNNGFFDTSANYVGAFKENNWLNKWTKFDYVTTTSIDEVEVLPKDYLLHQNYPNPFNPATTIKYSIPKSSFVNITVYDILGREISSLVNEEKLPGNYEIKFDGNKLTSGIYIYQINAGNFSDSKKLMLVK